MSTIAILIMVVVNIAVSVAVCFVSGRYWLEARVVGGLPRAIAICGALQAIAVFTGLYLLLLTAIAVLFGWLEPDSIQSVIDMTHLEEFLPRSGVVLVVLLEGWRQLYMKQSMTKLQPERQAEFRQSHRWINEQGTNGVVGEWVDETFEGAGTEHSPAFTATALILAFLIGGGIILPSLLILLNVATIPLPGDDE